MHRIDGPGATVDNKFTDGDPVGGVPATLVTDDWLNDMQEELMSLLTAAAITPVKGTQNQVLSALRSLAPGIIGAVRNARMSVAATSATGAFTADQVVVGTGLGGATYRLNGFNKNINLATVGAGGMDTGTATANGFVGIYAIYNPTTQVSALLAMMEASAILPIVYGGANMPAGYTASALISVAPISATAGQFAPFFQLDRSVDYAGASVLSGSTAIVTGQARASTSIPYSARYVAGFNQVGSTALSGISQIITSTALSTVGGQFNTSTVNGSSQAIPFRVAISLPQTIYQTTTNTAGVPSFTISVKAYEF
jgi:hypothetical protein